MLLDYKSLHDGLNQAEINALYSILRKETIFTETLLMGTTGKYGVYNIVDTGIQVVNAIPTGQYTFNFSDGTVGVGVANDEGIVDVDISFDRSSVCDVVITFPPYVTSVDYNLSLTGDKSIIQKDESVVVTALLTIDGSLVSGESLDYVVKHGNRVLDSGTITTGSDGTASITYTGTGVGDVSVEVTYSTLLQETYELLDATFYDKAISSDYNSNWTNVDYTVSRDTTGTTIADNKTSGWTNYSSPYIPFPTTEKTIIEFDIVSYNGNVYFQLIDSTGPNFDSNLYNAAPYHVKMEITASTIIRTVNNSSTTFTTSDYMDGTPFKFMFAQNTNGRWLKYKNFVIYTIGTYNLTLSSDKDILSAHDGESATITALLTEDNVPIEDIELEYSIKHDNTVIDSGTITTDSDGEVNIVYTATGVGDVDVIVSYGTLLQETFVIEDTIAYSDCTNNSIENIIDVPSNVKNSTYEFSSNGWKYGNVSTYTNMPLQSSISLSKPLALSLKLIENSGDGLSFNIGKSGNDWIYLSIQYGELIYNGNRLKAPVMGAEYTVKVFSDKIEIYENDTLLYTDNITLTEWYVALGTGTNRYVRIKDFKIKAL